MPVCTYLGCDINYSAGENLDLNLWLGRAVIYKGGNDLHVIKTEYLFKSANEAESAALTLAKDWVDRNA